MRRPWTPSVITSSVTTRQEMNPMRPTPSRFRRISVPEEGGFTLLELVFSVSILLVVMGSILGVFGVVQRQSAYVKDRSETLDTMRIAVDRMTKEIRQARVVEPDATLPES